MHQTSRAAYHSVKSDGTIQNQQAQILKALLNDSGNAYQVSQRIPLDKHCIGRRMSELLAAQLIQTDGTLALTDTGRKAVVYSITDAGRRLVA